MRCSSGLCAATIGSPVVACSLVIAERGSSLTAMPLCVQWCERWNLGVSNDMMLLAVHAHTAEVECIHVGGGEANLTSTLAVATVFVPVATQ